MHTRVTDLDYNPRRPFELAMLLEIFILSVAAGTELRGVF